MRRNKAHWGDMVQANTNGAIIGQGVVESCPIHPEDNTYSLDCTYGDGWSASEQTHIIVQEEQITVVEKGWHQKWSKRVFRR